MQQHTCFTVSAKGFSAKQANWRWLPAFVVLNLLACTASAQNLIVNGNFESGTFAPWTSSGNVSLTGTAIQGSFSCIFGFLAGNTEPGKIEQAVITTAGKVYYLTADIVNLGATDSLFLSATSANREVDGTREVRPSSQSEIHYSLIFTASSAETTISIENESGFLVDNVRLLELPAHPRAGRYTGSAKAKLTSEPNGLSNSVSSKVVARVKPTGQIVLLRGGSEVGGGILLPDNTLELRLDGKFVTGLAVFRGTKLTFTLTAAPNALDEGLNPIDSVLETTFALTRVGR